MGSDGDGGMAQTEESSLRPTRTRILATLGPSSFSEAMIEALVRAGATAFRLNFSHGGHDDLAEAIEGVRRTSDRLGVPLSLLADLSGPKLRTGDLDTPQGQPLILATGQRVLLSSKLPATGPAGIRVSQAVMDSELVEGTRILLDDGKLELAVTHRDDDGVWATVIFGGPLSRQKGINIPGVRLAIPAITEKDRLDLGFALDHGVDFVALSFVQSARDVVELKRLIAERGCDTPVISKIEKPIAVQELDSILEVSDGMMVARGDLGVEMGPEALPIVQKEIIELARRKGKIVITATQMLESMTHAPRPTRAEASDVANAIMDGSDAVMLSGETAVGDFPVETVATMKRIAASVEGSRLYRDRQSLFGRPEADHGVALSAVQAACVAAEQLGARALMLYTSSGWTAFACSAWRPETELLACTTKRSTYQRFGLCWGLLNPVVIPPANDINELYLIGMQALISAGHLRGGDLVVVLSGSVVFGRGANTIRISRVGSGDLSDDERSRKLLQRLVMRPDHEVLPEEGGSRQGEKASDADRE